MDNKIYKKDNKTSRNATKYNVMNLYFQRH